MRLRPRYNFITGSCNPTFVEFHFTREMPVFIISGQEREASARLALDAQKMLRRQVYDVSCNSQLTAADPHPPLRSIPLIT